MARGTFGRWLRHLSSLLFPLLTLGFVATGPHSPIAALPGIAIVAAVVLLDRRARPAAIGSEPTVDGPSWPFTALAIALALVQLATLALLVRMVALQGWSWSLVVVGWFVGNNSGWGTLVVAHELIHRRQRPLRWLGRALLCTVLYDHFFVEHLRGHHVRVATADDPATARFGESYHAFFRRTVPAQFRSAWRLARRDVLVGLAVEAALLAAIAVIAGWPAIAVFLWQAYNAITVLEAVNYFEHWGLQRRGTRPDARDAWDTESWLTLYTLIGLSRHADHHAHAARPFERLRAVDESPKLPGGYYAMVTMAQLRNKTFRARMTDELKRKRLGPFTDETSQGDQEIGSSEQTYLKIKK
ncbi:MAG: Alkane-1 monooxygenase [bacterium]|nr:Alkane-1 monooxygenase [bacterium]